MSDEMNKKFHFHADVTFSATDLEDAFKKLAMHFMAMHFGADSNLHQVGRLDLRPEKPQ